MRRAFTMIELIFVIVILGILAAVAIPRLAASRDDAEVVKTLTNISLVTTETMSYYLSQGGFADDLGKMTNFRDFDGDGKFSNGVAKVGMKSAGKVCMYYEMHQEYGERPIYYRLVPNSAEAEKGICKKILENASIKAQVENTFELDGSSINGNPIAIHAIR